MKKFNSNIIVFALMVFLLVGLFTGMAVAPDFRTFSLLKDKIPIE